MLELLAQEAQRPNPLALNSEADRLRVLAAAVYSIRKSKKNPGGYFRTLLKGKSQNGFSTEDEETARQQLRELRGETAFVGGFALPGAPE